MACADVQPSATGPGRAGAAVAVAVARARRHARAAAAGKVPGPVPGLASTPAAARTARGPAVAVQADPGAEKTVTVCLRNPYKSPSALGCYVDHSDGETLQIERILSGGLLHQWNEEHPECVVIVGDRIVRVNGQTGRAVDLVNILGRSLDLELHILLNSQKRAELGNSRASHPAPQKLRPGWYVVEAEGGAACHVLPDGAAPKALQLRRGERVQVAEGKRDGWAQLVPQEVKARLAPKPQGETGALLGDIAFALRDLSYGGAAVREGSLGTVVALGCQPGELSVDWRRSGGPNGAVVYPGQVAVYAQAWTCCLHAANEQPPLREVEQPQGGVQATSPTCAAPNSDGAALTPEQSESWRERVREIQRERLLEEGVAKVIEAHSAAWARFEEVWQSPLASPFQPAA